MVIRVFIREGHSLIYEALRRLLATHPSIHVVGGVALGDVDAVIAEVDPDILLVDGRMRGALSFIRQGGVRPWTIVLAPEDEEDWAVQAMMSGAKGILEKSSSVDELCRAIEVVHEGQIWARKEVIARAMFELVALSSAIHSARAFPSERLSAREHEVVLHASQGMSNKEIADRLAVSEATVKAHLTNIFQKLGVRDRAQLIALYHGGPGNPRRPIVSTI